MKIKFIIKIIGIAFLMILCLECCNPSYITTAKVGLIFSYSNSIDLNPDSVTASLATNNGEICHADKKWTAATGRISVSFGWDTLLQFAEKKMVLKLGKVALDSAEYLLIDSIIPKADYSLNLIGDIDTVVTGITDIKISINRLTGKVKDTLSLRKTYGTLLSH